MTAASPASARPGVADTARREQARELGASLMPELFRLFKIAQIHAINNTAVVQQIERTTEALRLFSARTGGPVHVLFGTRTVFVGGQLLRGSRAVYKAALALGAMLAQQGVAEILFQADVEAIDVKGMVVAFVAAARDLGARERLLEPSQRISLRRPRASALVEDDDHELSPDEQIVRAYASSVVVMRRVLDDVADRRYVLRHEAKRIAQKLVMLSEGDTPAFLGVTGMRNAHHDAAGRAVSSSILAVAIARQLTDDLGVLARVAMAALLHGVGEARLVAAPGGDSTARRRPIMPVGDHDRPRLAASTALVLTAMGKLQEPSIVRTVIAYEAQRLSWRRLMGRSHADGFEPTIAARVVAIAHRFSELLAPDPAAAAFTTTDEAIAALAREAEDETERAMVALLVGAVGLLPRGTAVVLDTGERGVVVANASHPAEFATPVVRLVIDSDGLPLDAPVDVDLAVDATRCIVGVAEVDPCLEAVQDQLLGATPLEDLPAAAAALLEHADDPVVVTSVPAPPAEPIAPPEAVPTAEGTLDRSPLVHLLVYMLDKGMTGTLVLTDAGAEHALYVERGVPAKAWTSVRAGSLAEIVMAMGIVDEPTLAGALLASPGDDIAAERELTASAMISPAFMGQIFREQFEQRLAVLFALPGTTSYAFYTGTNLLTGRCSSKLTPLPALATILAGVRAHPERERIDQMLERLGPQRVALHYDADLDAFALLPEEQAVADVLECERRTVDELWASARFERSVLGNVLYTLTITRSLNLGADSTVAPVRAPRLSIPPPSEERARALARTRPSTMPPPGAVPSMRLAPVPTGGEPLRLSIPPRRGG